MASPPRVLQPVPTRSPEKEASSVDLHHPLPDLQSLQGAYVGNISRLEEHAERMSEAGSDLNEEIRRLHTELKQSDSRRSSLRSLGFPAEEPARMYAGRSRNVSTSSHAHSAIDTNGPARWGGYSPGGYVTSPAGSLRSGSWSNPPASLQRHRSGSKASRLGQVVHPEQVHEETEDAGDYPGSPDSIMAPPLEHHQQGSPPPPGQRQVSSFTRKYEEIANEIRDEMRNSVNLERPPTMDHYHDQDNDRYADGHHEPYPHHELPDRPPTAASTDTTHQARTLWHDFDGTHAPHTVPEEEEEEEQQQQPEPEPEPAPEPSHGSHSRKSSSLMRSAPDMPPQGAPPPEEGMVFYPAPVPRMLNLPKRLSQLPAGDVAARRRTQVLDQMQAANRKSAPWLGGTEPASPNRKSRKSFAGLPAQLRASAFFDQQGPSQEFEVKGESAEDTLDSILEASARAPVSAFTDHPFTGRVGNEVYSPEHKRKSTKLSLVEPVVVEPTKRRSSFNILDTNTNSTGGKLNKLKKRNSSADMNILVARAAESRMSLGAELDERDEHARGPNDLETAPRRNSSGDGRGRNPDAEFEEQALNDDDDDDDDEEKEEEEEKQFFGAPTTLLAELQLRKAKQKERNINYVTMVEEGRMTSHRTLLDLNDDAEREKQRRLKKKVQLAWEAQEEEEDDSDDDIPLGVLYKQPQRNDWDLITPHPESEEEEEHVGETLGERMRRLKDKQMLEAALGDDVRKSTVSGDFAAEMLSKLGVDDSPKALKDAPSASPALEDGEEETLGQRRARLKAEAEARGDILHPGERPALKSKMSLADVLSANPYDDHHQARKVSNEQLMSHLPTGSLLHRNAVAEEKRKAQRLTQTMRASSYGMTGPDPLLRGVGSTQSKDDEDQPLALKIQAYKDRMAGVGRQEQPRAQTMMFTPMGMNPTLNVPQQSTPMMGMNGVQSMNMVGQPNMMLPQQQMLPMQTPMMGMNNMGMMGQMSLQQPAMHPGMGNRQSSMPMQMSMMQGGPQMNVMGGMPMMQPMNGMGMQGMQMGGGMMGGDMMMQPMNTQQRSNIEGWMRGIR
ncbi:hypothetical protein BU25DRAFT_439160 [Macroventuria anomochaeta]|uniref:Uncharacterized protein n=1 Tax=Macroventuria anomochaeta TaxID=301207 RepID=A0ACB6S3K9_9PLEO|nr:uncharacterized protein BU25DRAFT_439160 [Macroventuria anomochaeta]KAF2628624.1 hypothetical protein BU25DRAFT_439160 [Macroventuria anomochaeta]